MLDKSCHDAIYAIYGYVRLADEIVDTFHDHDKGKLLDRFSQDTFFAIENKISTNPVLNAFQDTINKYNIDHRLIHAFLHSMKMDLFNDNHNQESYQEYIYGSAEVVGLMCLKVFCFEKPELYTELIPYARKLGAAFQKVNFLRDLKSDFTERGRVYFPGVNFDNFTSEEKKKIEDDIHSDFEQAWIGIRKLPKCGKLGVMVACIYYETLFRKIKITPASKISEGRIRINNISKISLLIQTWFRFKAGELAGQMQSFLS